ncbi:MAG: hypothetical protein WA761_07460 [Thermoplasmata archaeon]
MSAPRPPPANDSIEKALEDLTRSVKDLAIATTKVTERVFAKAGSAAKDPSDAMRKMARKMATELDAARQQIENAFRDLK